jgi:uncharacterized protein (TIGR00369 family)
MNDAVPPESLPRGFADELGVELIELDPAGARARIAVEKRHLQPFGIVHGGVYSSLVESICSTVTWLEVKDDGMAAMGQSNETTFVRAISGGHVNALARARHKGRSTWVWEVDITDDDGQLCALGRMTIAVRPQRPR